MKTVTINLGSIDKVKSFVNDITKFDSDFDLVTMMWIWYPVVMPLMQNQLWESSVLIFQSLLI